MDRRKINMMVLLLVGTMFSCGESEQEKQDRYLQSIADKKEARKQELYAQYPRPERDEVPAPEPAQQRLDSILAKNGETLCSMFATIGLIERRNGEIAYAKYPNNAVTMNTYHQSLNRQGMEMLQQEFGLTQEDIGQINWIGVQKCEW
jgi:hypothetical protein